MMDIRGKYQRQIAWLLEGDPSIRYQTLRDLVQSNKKDIESERENILKKGWGKRFIDLQLANGTWFFPLYCAAKIITCVGL